jgi:hypothetical protein
VREVRDRSHHDKRNPADARGHGEKVERKVPSFGKMKEIQQVPADRLLAEELVDDEVVEMANLTTAQTGVTGTIFISTAMGGHDPRVKYFVQPGRSQPSFSVSIADSPAILANSLPIRVLHQMSPQVIAWVSRNKDALLDFWHHGDTWTLPEVNAFAQTLQRV